MKRPMLFIFIFTIIGILTGQYFPQKGYTALFVVAVILICLILSLIYKNYVFFVLLVIFIASNTYIHKFNVPKSEYLESVADTQNSINIKCEVYSIKNNSNGSVMVFVNSNIEDNNINFAFYSENTDLKPGNLLNLNCKIKRLKDGGGFGFNEKVYYGTRFVDYILYVDDFIIEGNSKNKYYKDLLVNKVDNIIDNTFSDDTAGIAKALITGSNYDIDDSTYSVYSITGIAHVLAVSGLQGL